MIERGFYKHFKGNTYFVVCMAKHSETLELMVVYRRCGKSKETWVRPLTEWVKPLPDGKRRFKFIGKTLDPKSQERYLKAKYGNQVIEQLTKSPVPAPPGLVKICPPE